MLISQFFLQQTSKMALPGVVKRFELKSLKVTKYELIISNQSGMEDDHLPGGAPGAPHVY